MQRTYLKTWLNKVIKSHRQSRLPPRLQQHMQKPQYQLLTPHGHRGSLHNFRDLRPKEFHLKSQRRCIRQSLFREDPYSQFKTSTTCILPCRPVDQYRLQLLMPMLSIHQYPLLRHQSSPPSSLIPFSLSLPFDQILYSATVQR